MSKPAYDAHQLNMAIALAEDAMISNLIRKELELAEPYRTLGEPAPAPKREHLTCTDVEQLLNAMATAPLSAVKMSAEIAQEFCRLYALNIQAPLAVFGIPVILDGLTWTGGPLITPVYADKAGTNE